jgi:LacI family transcriptional regulator
MASIRDVAKEAGFAPATVSRYLSGQIRLSPDTQRRIEDAIAKLNYRPNSIARRLASGSSETLGFVTADIGYSFFASIASAAQSAAAELGYTLAVFNTGNDIQRELQVMTHLQTRQLDGLILMTNHVDTGRLAELIGADSNVVILDEDIPGASAPRVFSENREGGTLAARHLLENGHRAVAVISGPRGLISVEERLDGFGQELAAQGVPLPESMIHSGPYSEETGRMALNALWQGPSRPTAVFATADNICVGVIRAARATGIRIPEDLSIIGFDDIATADLFHPPLTTIRQETEAFGAEGVRLLAGRILGEIDATTTVRLPVTLMKRQSVSRKL